MYCLLTAQLSLAVDSSTPPFPRSKTDAVRYRDSHPAAISSIAAKSIIHNVAAQPYEGRLLPRGLPFNRSPAPRNPRGGTLVYRHMRKYLLAFILVIFTAWAANLKLNLKDGSYHVVREYQVQTDRVHFYSIERSQWEDIPLDLVDLKRTESEAADRKAKLDADAKVIAEEEKIERDMAKEVSRIPQDAGVYWVEGKETKVLKQAESTVHHNKGRSVLKRLSPIPMVTGRATVELQGAHSQTVFT